MEVVCREGRRREFSVLKNSDQWIQQLAAAGIVAAPELLERLCSKEEDAPLVRRIRDLLSGPSFENGERSGILLSLLWDQWLEGIEADLPIPDWVQRLPAFEGDLILSGADLEAAAWDFGKVRRRKPLALLRPAHTEDVARAVRFCREEGIPISPRGFAHSAGAQMQVRQGLVVDMKSLSAIVALEDDFCEVEAGAGWDVVLRAATDRGKTPPIVTDWLRVSVGGTLSMGGFGFMSFWRGTQMDHLLELEVVTGTGDVVRCSADRHRDLFDAVRGTHGKFGIITRARIPLEDAPEKVRMIQACYGKLGSMLGDFEQYAREQSTDLIHAFAAEKSRSSILTKMNSTESLPFDEAAVDRALSTTEGEWVYNLELVDFVGGPHGDRHAPVDETTLNCEPGLVAVWEMGWEEFCFRIPPLVLEEQDRGAAPHPELCTWVPSDSAGLKFLEEEFDRLHPAKDIGNGPVLFFPLKTDTVSPPFFRLPESEYGLFWGVLRRAEPATADRIADLMTDNEAIYDRLRALGGERYLPDTPPETAVFWKNHFGPIWSEILRSRMKWDPDEVFGSSFGALTGKSKDDDDPAVTPGTP